MIKQPNKITEVYEIEHKGITVGVRIDYVRNQINIVDRPAHLEDHPKSWVFARRGVEYMNSWLNILEAIQVAIKDAKKRYEDELAEQSKFTDIGKIGGIPVFVINEKQGKKVVKKKKANK